MTDHLKALLAPADLVATAFPPESRYHGVEVKTGIVDGEQRVYVGRRFVPPQSNYSVVQEYRVADGDRLDNITAQFVGDAQQYWQLCDANAVLSADDLEVSGELIAIAVYEGVAGGGNG